MDLRPKRDFLFIDDFIEAIRLSFGQKNFDIYNIGSSYSVSVEEIITTILTSSGKNKPYLAKGEERKNETWDVYADISKIKKQLYWEPSTNFEKGIQRCVDEYKASL